jgi:hypothetical protein
MPSIIIILVNYKNIHSLSKMIRIIFDYLTTDLGILLRKLKLFETWTKLLGGRSGDPGNITLGN